jgi:hypothetical protein
MPMEIDPDTIVGEPGPDDVPKTGRRKGAATPIGRFRFDPLGFVMHAFPWGRPGTALAGETGPEPW